MEDICSLRHQQIEEKLKEHDDELANQKKYTDTKLEEIGKELIEQALDTARITVMMENLCKQIGALVSAMKWAGGLVIVTLVGFFIWYVQSIPK